MAVSTVAGGTDAVGGEAHSRGGAQRWRPSRLSVVVLVLGFGATAGLTLASRTSYLHTERRLTQVQSTLVADALEVAPIDVERRLGEAVAAAVQSPHAAGVFARMIAPSLATHGGPFSAVGLVRVDDGRATQLYHAGAGLLHAFDSPQSAGFFRRASRTPLLTTSHNTSGRAQRLDYALSRTGPAGTLVAYAGEVLPEDRRVTVKPSSPEYGFDIALYFGKRATTGSLLLTNAASLPIRGTVTVAHVPFGTNTLTLVSAPTGAIAGAWAATLPWGILGVGLVLSVLFAALVDRLVRREVLAAEYAVVIQELYDQERTVAETLQHSLLPRSLPEVDGLEFSARYVPGTRGLEVGGDWYDVAPVGPGSVLVSVGDVSGKGLSAASMMATLRHAIRARASYGLAPSEILSQLSTLVDLARDGHFATISCARIDLETGCAEVASAGHLPPLELGGSSARLLEVKGGPPVGLGTSEYQDVTVDFAAGSTLLFYTDGLVERRDERLDVSLARLVQLCGGDRTLEERLDDLLGELVGASPHDDVAILGVRRR